MTVSAEFGERAFEEAASLFRSIREFFIDKFGMEDADKALPGFQIDCYPRRDQPPANRAALPRRLPSHTSIKKEPVLVQPNADFAAAKPDIAPVRRG